MAPSPKPIAWPDFLILPLTDLNEAAFRRATILKQGEIARNRFKIQLEMQL
jgi:hypothetical protein